jgi:hypothetical protein
VKSRRYVATGIRITPQPEGGIEFDYGGSLGSRTFADMTALRQHVSRWIDERRKKLIREAAELEQVEKDLQK